MKAKQNDRRVYKIWR